MQNGYYAFKMDLDAKMKNQRGKHAIQYAKKFKLRPKFYIAMDQTAKMKKNRDTECNVLRQTMHIMIT